MRDKYDFIGVTADSLESEISQLAWSLPFGLKRFRDPRYRRQTVRQWIAFRRGVSKGYICRRWRLVFHLFPRIRMMFYVKLLERPITTQVWNRLCDEVEKLSKLTNP